MLSHSRSYKEVTDVEKKLTNRRKNITVYPTEMIVNLFRRVQQIIYHESRSRGLTLNNKTLTFLTMDVLSIIQVMLQSIFD